MGVYIPCVLVEAGGGGGAREQVVVDLDVNADFGPDGLERADLLVLFLDVERTEVQPEERETPEQGGAAWVAHGVLLNPSDGCFL